MLVKTCSKCKVEKELSEFHKRNSARDALRSDCKQCVAAYSSSRQRKHNLVSARKWKLRTRYGLTVEQYFAMFEKQDHKCAICCEPVIVPTKDSAASGYVDHDHETGKVRGILCLKCNTGLGKFNDNTELLTRAISYIKEHSECHTT